MPRRWTAEDARGAKGLKEMSGGAPAGEEAEGAGGRGEFLEVLRGDTCASLGGAEDGDGAGDCSL